MSQFEIKPEIIQLDMVDSTSNYVAKSMMGGDYVPGTAILAHFQHTGRGQRGSIWQSAPGLNLTFSFALPVGMFAPHQRFLLAKAISVGLARAVEELIEVATYVKWPNDLLSAGRKIAGMLLEFKSLDQPYAIVGIGLNVNQVQFENSYKATSLALEKGARYELIHVFQHCRKHLNAALRMLLDEEAALKHQYNALLYGKGQYLSFSTPERSFSGRILEVDDQGFLLVQSRQGQVGQYAPKEIKINY